MSPSVARITGPGTVPLYVQAGKKTPGAISMLAVDRAHRVLAHAARLVRQRLGRIEQLVQVVRPADGRRLPADHRRVTHVLVPVDVAVQRARRGRLRVAVEGELAEHGRRHDAAQRPPAAARRVNLGMPKSYRRAAVRNEGPVPGPSRD